MAKVIIKQIKSVIGRPENQKRTMKALGLGKINKTTVKEVTPQVAGMIKKVEHLIEVSQA